MMEQQWACTGGTSNGLPPQLRALSLGVLLLCCAFMLAGCQTAGPLARHDGHFPAKDCDCRSAADSKSSDCDCGPADTVAASDVPAVGSGPEDADEDCRRGCDFPSGAIPAPPGTYLRQTMLLQQQRAEATDFVIHEREWYRGGVQLGPDGRSHLRALIARLPLEPHPVVIEQQTIFVPPDLTYDQTLAEAEALNHARREVIVSALFSAGIPDADQRVVIGESFAEPLLGTEAPRVFRQFIRGGGMGGGGGGFGGGGGGFGGGGGGFGGGGGGFGGSGGGGFGGGGF